jgi:hypothetical protein
MQNVEKKELLRRLEQSRRLVGEASAPTTKGRLQELTRDLKEQLAVNEARDAEASQRRPILDSEANKDHGGRHGSN